MKYIFLFFIFFGFRISYSQNTAVLTGATYKERAEAIISQTSIRVFNANTIETRAGFVYCAARYYKNIDLAYADSQLNILLDRAIAGDADTGFTTFQVMQTYLLCKPKLNNALKLKIRLFMQSIDFNFERGYTYNLTLMPHAAAYLACEEWPDYVDASGRTHDEIQLFSKRILARMLDEAFLLNNQEIDAPIYYMTNLGPFRMLSDHTKDDFLQRKAFSTYQACLALINAGYNKGLYIANPTRSKSWNNLGDGLKRASGLGSFAWVLFGTINEPFYYEGFNEGKGLEVMNFWLYYQGYTQPKASIIESSKNKTYPYFKKGLGFKRTYQSLNYGLANWDTPAGDPNESYNWKESKRTYLAWQSDTIDCHFTISQENPRRPSEPTIPNCFGCGDNPYQRVMQYKGTAIGIWNVPLDYTFYKLYNAFPKNAFKGILQKNGWIVCHTGSMMFAIKTIEPYTWDTTSHAIHNLQWVDNRKGGWILETTELSSAWSGDFASQMNQYVNALQANTNIITINYSSSNPRLKYKSLQGDILDITYFDPNVTYTNQFIINGVTDSITSQITDDICAYQDYNSNQLQIKSNGVVVDTLIKDQPSQNSIVLQPAGNALNLSTAIASPTYHWIVPEGSIFLNNTNPFVAKPKIQLPFNIDVNYYEIKVYVDDGRVSKRLYSNNSVMAENGFIRFNSTNYEFEGYSNNQWVSLEKNTFVLDKLTTEPIASFSLRKLRSNYIGPAIKVRRSTDNAIMDINFTANGFLDEVALLNFVGSSNGYIQTWYNQSSSNNLVMNTLTMQPAIVINGVIIKKNGKPGIFVNGTSRLDGTALSPPVLIDDCYLNVVKEHTGATVGGVLDLGSAPGFRFSVNVRSELVWLNSENFKIHNPTIANSGFAINGFRSSSSENKLQIYVNGYLAASKTKAIDTRTSNRFSVFADANGILDYGTTSEIMVFKTALTNVERLILERNQAKYYNVE